MESRTDRPTPPSEDGVVVVATDGSPGADPAFIAAAFVAGRIGADVRVLSVLECGKLSAGTERDSSADHGAEHLRQAMATRSDTVKAQLALTVGAAAGWPVTVVPGSLGLSIQRFTKEHNPRLLFVGQRGATPFSRVRSGHDIMRIVERSPVPVYVATSAVRGVPRRAVIAVDFRAASLRAVHEIVQMSATDATLYLVHVLTELSPGPPAAADGSIDECRLALRQLEESVRGITGIQVRSALLFGRPGVEILRFAEGIDADIIACGADASRFSPLAYQAVSRSVGQSVSPSLSPSASRSGWQAGLPLMHRPARVGRVAMHFVAHAPCSVLVVPDTSRSSRESLWTHNQ